MNIALQASAKSGEARPGRSCPLHYRYGPGVFHRPPDFDARTLYVVGGLYGNRFALSAVLEMASQEKDPVRLVFNGDFNWFNVDAPTFASINETVLRHTALRGNVETEMATGSEAAGCGCGYPEWVADAEVERSNAIMRLLRRTAGESPALQRRLGELPMHLVAGVGGLRLGIVHGDAESLAGWDFSQERLRDEPDRAQALLASARVRILACTHTCLPVMQDFETPVGTSVIANNGAAGMPNFRGLAQGLITRVSVRPAQDSLYGIELEGVHVDAVPVRYNAGQWIEQFDRAWPPGSAAAQSYRGRIADGPAYVIDQAVRGSVILGLQPGQG